MTREEAIEILKNSTMKDTLSEQWKEAYKMAIKALEQKLCDCRSCKKWDECPCGKEGHENGTSVSYSVGECRDYEQEDILDKIRAKIEALTDRVEPERIWNVDVLAIIDKYKAESEVTGNANSNN